MGQKYFVVDSSIVYEILLRMRDDELFDYCVDITAVHYPKRERSSTSCTCCTRSTTTSASG